VAKRLNFFCRSDENRCRSQKHEVLLPYAEKLEKELGRLQKVTMHLLGLAQGNNEVFLADATLYMELFGIITVAWQWLKQGVVAQNAIEQQAPTGDELAFYQDKIHTMKFYFHYELIKTLSLAARLLDTEVLTVLQEEVEA
jgi:butyryl-CoA dehydrogenase